MKKPSEKVEDITFDFSPGKIDTESFPFTQWRKYAKDVMDESSKDLLLLGILMVTRNFVKKLHAIYIILAALTVRLSKSSLVLVQNNLCR